MRPIKLELKGFTAFREKCEVDFSKFDLFAITRQTGAGKTSLLDAITYALYGKTSRLNKAGKDLISQGANSMSVLLHFRVGGKEYRVARMIKGSVVTARLEISENGDWKPSSGSIADVNDQIQRIVGLDFGGFTKTVILPQGKFDVFLRGEPRERREVLAELLDVEVYQRMVKTSNERAKDAGIRAEERTASIDATATHEARVEAEHRFGVLSADEGVAAALRQKLVKSLSAALSLREKRNVLAKSQRELEETGRKVAETNSAASVASGQVQQQSEMLSEIDRQIKATPYDGDVHLRLKGLLPQAQHQNRLGEQIASTQARLKVKNAQLHEVNKLLEATRERAAAETSRLDAADQKRRDASSLHKELQSKHGSVDAISLTIGDIERALKDASGIPALTEQIEELVRRADVLTVEIEEAGESIDNAENALAAADKVYERLHARDRGAALRHELRLGEPCPVCEQTVNTVPAAPDSGSLAQAGKRVEESKATVKRCENRRRELSSEAQGIPARIDLARAQAVGLQRRLEQAVSRVKVQPEQRVEEVVPVLRGIVAEIKAADLTAQEANSGYEVALGQQLEATNAYQKAAHDKDLIEAEAANITEQIHGFEQELVELSERLGDVPSLEEITVQIKALETARTKRGELEGKRTASEATLRSLKESVAIFGETLAGLESHKTAIVAAIEELQKEVTKQERQIKKALGETVLAESPDEATQIQRMEQASSKQLEGLQGEVQRCRFEIEDLARRIERNERLVQEIAQLKAESALYRDLASLLNAGTFQQYLLGSAFEVLAKEGSRHLRKLSSDRYEFVFEDDEFMVSDHSNADETRSVKTLSGGESFLASLSLALALAESITQLNEERGALSLESLFLDEGFSTLDSETLTKVADAIELLQDGNRLVGIITHIQSLADQMPVRIEIEKTVAGSRIIPQAEVRAFSA